VSVASCENWIMSSPRPALPLSPSKAGGRLLILVAAVLWSTSGFFVKSPIFEDWPLQSGSGIAVRGPLLAFWRAVFASLILVPLVRRPRWTPKLILPVLVFAAMNVAYLTALTHTTAANAIWLQHTAPVWIFLVGVCCLREKVHPRDWWLLGFAVSGVGLILGFELQGQSLQGVAYGLLAGVTYAGVVLSLRWLRDEDPAWLIAVNHGVTALLLLPYVVYLGIWPSGQQTLFLSAFGVFQMGVPYWFFARGVRAIPGHEAAGIVLLEPLLVPLWVYWAWHNEPTYQSPAWWTLAGGTLILTGLVLRYAKQRR